MIRVPIAIVLAVFAGAVAAGVYFGRAHGASPRAVQPPMPPASIPEIDVGPAVVTIAPTPAPPPAPHGRAAGQPQSFPSLGPVPDVPELPAVQTVQPSGAGFAPGVEAWRHYLELVAPALGNPAPTSFVLGWMTEESAGEVCAIGFPGQVDGRGQALETGLLQYMAPHDIALAGTTVAEQRAACSRKVIFPELTPAVLASYHEAQNLPPAKWTAEQSSAVAVVNHARAVEQTQVRPLTEPEKFRHAIIALQYIRGVRNIVDRAFAQYGHRWSPSTNDYWAMIKAYHAGIALPHDGLAAATAALGHLPATWQEYKEGIWASGIGHKWDHLLYNAEKCGACAFPRVGA